MVNDFCAINSPIRFPMNSPVRFPIRFPVRFPVNSPVRFPIKCSRSSYFFRECLFFYYSPFILFSLVSFLSLPFSLIIIIIRTIRTIYIKEYIFTLSIPVTQVETTVLLHRGTTGDSVGLTVHTRGIPFIHYVSVHTRV